MGQLLYRIGLCLAIDLLICLFPMQYGSYILVRNSAMIGMSKNDVA